MSCKTGQAEQQSLLLFSKDDVQKIKQVAGLEKEWRPFGWKDSDSSKTGLSQHPDAVIAGKLNEAFVFSFAEAAKAGALVKKSESGETLLRIAEDCRRLLVKLGPDCQARLYNGAEGLKAVPEWPEMQQEERLAALGAYDDVLKISEQIVPSSSGKQAVLDQANLYKQENWDLNEVDYYNEFMISSAIQKIFPTLNLVAILAEAASKLPPENPDKTSYNRTFVRHLFFWLGGIYLYVFGEKPRAQDNEREYEGLTIRWYQAVLAHAYAKSSIFKTREQAAIEFAKDAKKNGRGPKTNRGLAARIAGGWALWQRNHPSSIAPNRPR